MLIIGLTGSTGSGKGEFSRFAKENLCIYHIDTDKIAREVVLPGKPCLCDIVKRFGKTVLNCDNSLNRATLGEIVFSDKTALLDLNKITHHYITDEVEKIIKQAEKEKYKACIVDAPLLFESGEDKICHVTVGIIAPIEMRLKRIMARDNITEEMAKKRISNGKPDEFFTEKCDYILINNGDAKEFYEKTYALLSQLLNSQAGTL